MMISLRIPRVSGRRVIFAGSAPAMHAAACRISPELAPALTKASWIRRMFEEGARLKAERGADKVFDFTLGNPEIEPPAAVLAAARRVLDSDARHLHAYMPNAGHPRVREAVAARLSSATGLPYTANHVLMTVRGGGTYPASAFVEIEALLARAARPIVLISDEPYRALVFDDVVVPQVPPLVTRSIVATSWSKSLAIPGERIGYLAFSPRMPEAAALFEACTFTSRVLGFVNAPALWQWVVAEVGDQVIDVAPYREKRDLMYEGLTRIGYRCVKPQGAFYVFPRTPIEDDVAFVRLLAEEGVLTVPGSGFGMPGHIRISLTVERETIVCALPGFERAFRKAQATSRPRPSSKSARSRRLSWSSR